MSEPRISRWQCNQGLLSIRCLTNIFSKVLSSQMLEDRAARNRRSSRRRDVIIDAEVEIGDRCSNAEIDNLSLGGAQLALGERLPIGMRLRLRFQVPHIEDIVDIGATVRWSDGENIGVQFEGLRPKIVWSLNRYFAMLDTDRSDTE